MKKLILIIAFAAALTACNDNSNETGFYQVDETFTIRRGAWLEGPDDGPFEYWYYEKAIPRFSYDAYRYGMYKTYLDRDGAGYWDELPFITFGKNNDYEWTITISVDYIDGLLTFYHQSSDFVYERPDRDYKIRFVAFY